MRFTQMGDEWTKAILFTRAELETAFRELVLDYREIRTLMAAKFSSWWRYCRIEAAQKRLIDTAEVTAGVDSSKPTVSFQISTADGLIQP